LEDALDRAENKNVQPLMVGLFDAEICYCDGKEKLAVAVLCPLVNVWMPPAT
jgi:hypothetical protein